MADRVRDDPPDYDADPEGYDQAGEAWQEAAYPSGVTDPGSTSGPRGLDGQPRCRACNGLIRWDTEHYGSPRWVHVHIVDVVDCPEPGDIQPGNGQFFKAEQVF